MLSLLLFTNCVQKSNPVVANYVHIIGYNSLGQKVRTLVTQKQAAGVIRLNDRAKCSLAGYGPAEYTFVYYKPANLKPYKKCC